VPARRLFRRAVGIVAAGIAAALAACTDDGTTTPTSPPPIVTTTTAPLPVEDGILRIGLLLPESGEGATIGQPLIEAAKLAVQQVNAAGGVLDQPVELVDGFDEGNNATTASEAIAALLERDVDAVVGPASSTVALATLEELLSAGVLTCSPTATAIALDDFPTSPELFFRTAPSDSLQAGAIAQYAERTGARTAAVTYLDDAYGRPLATATADALQARGLTLIDPVPFAANDELTDEAAAISDSDVDVVVVIGDSEQGTRMLAELGEVAGLFPSGDPPVIIVNDAVRRPPSPQLVQALAADVRNRVVGVSPLAFRTEPEEPAGPFATNALDCVNLIALSAIQAGTDAPPQIAAQMADVSSGGVSCRAFAECVQLLPDSRIDYDGPGGVLEIGANGDPVRARFDLFEFNDNGEDVSRAGTLVVPR
jgi:branched-chain amino acid transport system substrate-binding protein